MYGILAISFIDKVSLSSLDFTGGFPIAAVEMFIHLSLFIIMTSFSTAGIVFGIVCIIFNLIYREKR